ncbi:MAG: helix-turn-helix domain-containing protein [Deltaproteobacteria bacterium]|nr:MAG: helix-turn-helix domain-containing protein [Deltaproteobacteria bacterium]
MEWCDLRLGVSESTVRRLLRREPLPSVKVGGRRRVAASALRAVAHTADRVTRAADVAALTIDDPLFELAAQGQRRGSHRRDGRTAGRDGLVTEGQPARRSD